MKSVNWKDSNRTQVIAKGFKGNENAATTAIDAFLEDQGENYGRADEGEYDAQTDTFYFRVTDYS